MIDPQVIERYLLLGLRLGRHIDGFVDAYYGPPELAQRVASEPMPPPGDLVKEAVALRTVVEASSDRRRAHWLSAQLDGLQATAERLDGRDVQYIDEIRRCYGVTAEPADEAVLADAHRRLSELLPGHGSLRDRYQSWRRAQELSSDEILVALERINEEIRARTRTLFGLPDGETVELEIVSNEPWAGFNYYQGGLKSRVVINSDVPRRAPFLVDAAAHESYPGHHTEHAWKEALLVRGQGLLEESIFLIGTPQSLISEGIATNALRALGPEAEPACAAILADMGRGYDVELSRAVSQARRPLDQAWANVVLMIHVQGRPVSEAREFAGRWLLEPDEQIDKRIEFILHPTWRTYLVLYDIAERLVQSWTRGEPARFKRLLTEPMTASDLTN